MSFSARPPSSTGRVSSDCVLLRTASNIPVLDVIYDIKVKGGERRLLDHVDGRVEPGKLTALMGESGAGKVS